MGHLDQLPHFGMFKGLDEIYEHGHALRDAEGNSGNAKWPGARSVVFIRHPETQATPETGEGPNQLIMDGDGGREKNAKIHTRDQSWDSTGNSGLLQCWRTGAPVRVCRGWRTRYGPAQGYRYDGCWSVINVRLASPRARRIPALPIHLVVRWRPTPPFINNLASCIYYNQRLPDQPLAGPWTSSTACWRSRRMPPFRADRAREPEVYDGEETPRLFKKDAARVPRETSNVSHAKSVKTKSTTDLAQAQRTTFLRTTSLVQDTATNLAKAQRTTSLAKVRATTVTHLATADLRLVQAKAALAQAYAVIAGEPTPRKRKRAERMWGVGRERDGQAREHVGLTGEPGMLVSEPGKLAGQQDALMDTRPALMHTQPALELKRVKAEEVEWAGLFGDVKDDDWADGKDDDSTDGKDDDSTVLDLEEASTILDLDEINAILEQAKREEEQWRVKRE
ncbi:hypothetical protein BD626DRAFT_576037 [Schizophyllum amplum]|uniref:YDG domain-containing protein n=1 Tax=Schizophyllum amplum TaxID=97359 RepID=A0A550BUG6_9AGAR|nr:hypothetical protein BD626DRAFT_576037 [Auriculariopsis ampla]